MPLFNDFLLFLQKKAKIVISLMLKISLIQKSTSEIRVKIGILRIHLPLL